VPLSDEIPIKRGHQRGVAPNKSLFYHFTILPLYHSSSVKTVADIHRLAAYHNKQWWRAFRGYQHRWPWTTLKCKSSGFLVNFSRFQAAMHISRVNWSEIIGDRSGQPAHEIFSIKRF